MNAWLNMEMHQSGQGHFPYPSLDGSMVVKSTQRGSSGPLAMMEPGLVLGPT